MAGSLSSPRWTAPLALAVLVALVGMTGCRPEASASDPTPVVTLLDPEQYPPDEESPIIIERRGWDFVLTPLAQYTLRGVVLNRTNYHFGWNSLLSPCDVSMAWGPLAQDDLWKRLSWSQSGRWYYWEYGSDFPYDNGFVGRYSCNTHVIPATRRIARAAKSLGQGDLAELEGLLVKVDGEKGGETVWWTSSTTRQDTGDGSCEVMYVRRLRAWGKVFE